MRLIIAAIALMPFFAASCSSPEAPRTTETTSAGTKAQTEAPKPKPASALSEQGTGDLMALLTAYYELKDALVATDTSKTNIAAARLLSAGETMKNTVTSDTAAMALRPLVASINNECEAIMTDKRSDIELKRASFEKVSDVMYKLLKEAKMTNAGVYYAYCPMAFNDKGAYWLSNDAEIKNPYFGKRMLECGEVKDSL